MTSLAGNGTVLSNQVEARDRMIEIAGLVPFHSVVTAFASGAEPPIMFVVRLVASDATDRRSSEFRLGLVALAAFQVGVRPVQPKIGKIVVEVLLIEGGHCELATLVIGVAHRTLPVSRLGIASVIACAFPYIVGNVLVTVLALGILAAAKEWDMAGQAIVLD
jgi:hypothetical protein